MADSSSSTAPTLFMVQARFDGRELLRSARQQGLPKNLDDLGYLLHGQLAALFGDLAPKPFQVERRGSAVEVLGYSPAGKEELLEQARTFALPADLESLLELSAKPMPESWATGRRLGFEVRTCPVVRLSSATEHCRAGKEVDAFLAVSFRSPKEKDLDREEIYQEWLTARLEPAARLVNAKLAQFRRVRLFRRTQGDKGKGQKREGLYLERPEALFQGELEITDAQAFSRLLARGVGRHRAFGLGMVLLKPLQRR